VASAAEITARLKAELAGVVKALALEITANLQQDCPVDTGHARANFVPSIGGAYTGEDDGGAQQAGIATVLGYRLDQGPIHISNNAPYLPQLIAGSSSQAPPGWDVAAIARAEATIEAEYGATIDISTGEVTARGGAAAGNVAGAYSPLGGDE
jgi:hypothetical protein